MTYQFTHQSKAAKLAILQKLKLEVEGADYKKLPEEKKFVYPEKSAEAQLVNFVQLLRNNNADVIFTDYSEITATILKELKKRNINSLLYGMGGPYSELLESTFSIESKTGITLKPYNFELSNNKTKMFNEIPASITGSRWAIAETGTIVVWPTEEEPRTMSLVPPLHFIVVDALTLHADFASLISDKNWKESMPTNVLLISGPSKTADIQQTLAFGAHGPKELIVLLLNT